MKKPILVIYHADCSDGFCAAYLFWRNFGPTTAEYLPFRYGMPAPDCTDRIVYIVDFSFPPDELLSMAHASKILVLLDHHKTAAESLAGFSTGRPQDVIVIDQTRSGARLAWDYLHPDTTPAPQLVQYVEDRDLWRFHLEDSKAISSYIYSFPYEFEAWERLDHELQYFTSTCAAAGRAIERLTQKEAERAGDRVMWRRIGGHHVPVVNATFGISETLHALTKRAYPDQLPHAPFLAPFAVGYFQEASPVGTPHFVYSLRSNGAFDVSAVAKQYGGGGHAAAAGFRSAMAPWEI